MRRSVLSLVALLTLLAIGAAAGYQPARAAGVVGTGTPGSCTAAAFGTALGGGGLVTFNCGAAPVVIVVPSESIPAANTTVDGGGKITLDGGNAVRIFHLIAGSTLTLTNITLRNGNVGGAANGGCILNDAGGFLVLNKTSVTACNANEGGGISNLGTATLNQSTVSGNTAVAGAGLHNVVGVLTLNNSTVSGNSATVAGGLFSGDAGLLTLNNSMVSGNRATAVGGGLFLDGGLMTLISSTVSANSANAGGGLYKEFGELALNNSTVSGNTASFGGGLLNYAGGNATLVNSSVSGNTAIIRGGGLYAYIGSKLLARNLTVSDNTAALGGGLFISPTAEVALTNTIIAYSPTGGNCGGGGAITSKYSLSSDGTCGLAGTGDQNALDPKLTGLGNYGGSTLVHMLKLGSPAINGVSGSDAPSTDQRGFARPIGGFYDIGAVERQAGDSDLAPRLFVPLIKR